jgi:hypothetical protein
MIPEVCNCEKDINQISFLICAIESHISCRGQHYSKLGDTVEQLFIFMSSIDQTR